MSPSWIGLGFVLVYSRKDTYLLFRRVLINASNVERGGIDAFGPWCKEEASTITACLNRLDVERALFR